MYNRDKEFDFFSLFFMKFFYTFRKKSEKLTEKGATTNEDAAKH